MKTALFDFALPEDRIASRPAVPRESARLLCVAPGRLDDRRVGDLPAQLRRGDLLVVNDTRVIPANSRAAAATRASKPTCTGAWAAADGEPSPVPPGV